MRRLMAVVVVTLSIGVVAGNAWGVQYTITALGGAAPTGMWSPSAINSLGQVAGYTIVSGAVYHAFVWDSTNGFRDLGVVGSGTSRAEAINDLGQVVGSSYADTAHYAFIWDKDNGMRSIGSLNSNANWSYALDINNASQVAGQSWSGTTYHPYVWTQAAEMQDITPQSSTQRVAAAINNHGVVAGYSVNTGWDKAFVWDSLNGLHELGDLGGGVSYAYGINDSGTAVGYSYLPGGTVKHAFVWTSSEGMRDLGGLGGSECRAECINKYGTIVGWADKADGTRSAVLWDNGTMYDLNNLIPSAPGWKIQVASGINDSGYIAGAGVSPSGQTQGVLLTPVPEPSTLALLGIGAVGLLTYGWRKRRIEMRTCNMAYKVKPNADGSWTVIADSP